MSSLLALPYRPALSNVYGGLYDRIDQTSFVRRCSYGNAQRECHRPVWEWQRVQSQPELSHQLRTPGGLGAQILHLDIAVERVAASRRFRSAQGRVHLDRKSVV